MWVKEKITTLQENKFEEIDKIQYNFIPAKDLSKDIFFNLLNFFQNVNLITNQ